MQVKATDRGLYKGPKAPGMQFRLDRIRDFSPRWMTPVEAEHDEVAEQAAEIKRKVYAEAREKGVRRLPLEREDAIEKEVVEPVKGGNKRGQGQGKKGQGQDQGQGQGDPLEE
jgi:hypothetical protein